MSLAEGRRFDDDRNTIYNTVYIDITSLPIAVETEGKNQTFYITGNDENVYIVKLSNKQYQKIREKYENSPADFTYRIVGRTNYIFTNLEKASLSAYNDNKGEKIITSSNYEEYFGKAYIDGTDNAGMIVGGVFYIIGGVFAVITLFLIIEYIHANLRLKQTIKEYGREKLEEQLNDPQTLAYQKAGAYLTKQFLISNSMDFKVISYDDILWIYILNRRLNFISIGKYIMAATKDGKCRPAVCSSDIKMLEEIMTKIYEKNPTIRLGFSKENQHYYNNYLNQKR